MRSARAVSGEALAEETDDLGAAGGTNERAISGPWLVVLATRLAPPRGSRLP